MMGDDLVSLIAPRLDEKPWGGDKLSRFGLPIDQGAHIGEALVTANDATITRGFGVGSSLGDVIASDPSAYLGRLGSAAVQGKPIFPLLVKLIDAAQNLSIQVHPDDEGARPMGKLGKTEAWFVLDSDDNGSLYLGLKEGITLDQFMQHAAGLDGSSAVDLRPIDAFPGITMMIPAGTVHALGAGVVVYEVQQPSDITYRLDDWGRVGLDGKPREMHLEEGREASRESLRPNRSPAIRLDVKGRRALLVACRYFALEQLRLEEGVSLPTGKPGSPEVITLLEGSLWVGNVELSAGQSAVVWPGSGDVIVRTADFARALRAWVPDFDVDVIQPGLAAGASLSDIAALSGMTDDIQHYLERYVID